MRTGSGREPTEVNRQWKQERTAGLLVCYQVIISIVVTILVDIGVSVLCRGDNFSGSCKRLSVVVGDHPASTLLL